VPPDDYRSRIDALQAAVESVRFLDGEPVFEGVAARRRPAPIGDLADLELRLGDRARDPRSADQPIRLGEYPVPLRAVVEIDRSISGDHDRQGVLFVRGPGVRRGPIGQRVLDTPLQTILVDLAGLENFSFHLFEYPEEVRALYNALLRKFCRQVEIVADAPGRFVSNLENFTAETLGPKRYKKFLLPVYEDYFPFLQDAGKIIGSHYDGQTKSCAKLIAQAPIDLVESLTPPPEGDLTLAEARAVWPDKLFWSNLNVALYQLPPEELRATVLERVAEAAPDGKGLAFEVSEHLPQNWAESMPVVLEALKETQV
jgi:hypothetical protein